MWCPNGKLLMKMNRQIRSRFTVGFATVAVAVLGSTAVAGAVPLSSSVTPSAQLSCGSSAASVVGPTHVGRILGMIRPRVDVAVRGCAGLSAIRPLSALSPVSSSKYNGGAPPLLIGDGDIMGSSTSPGAITITPIFWTPLITQAPSGYGFPSSYTTSLSSLTANLAASSGKPSTVLAELTQYTNVSGAHLDNQITAGTTLTSAAAVPEPTSGCTPDSGSIYNDGAHYIACVSDAQIAAEAQNVVSNAKLPVDRAHLYPVFLPEGIEVCNGSANGSENGTCTPNSGASSNGFCAYHSSTTNDQIGLLYVAMPYSVWDSATGLDCNATDTFPQANPPVDVIASTYVHEIAEAITDPGGNGWLDRRGNEIGDLCAYIYGPNRSTTTGARYNQVLNGQDYEIQQLFSNASYARNHASGCQSSWSVPTATLKSVGKAKVGVPVTLTAAVATPSGAVVARTWKVNGQVAGTGSSLTTTFGAVGSDQVTLTITDSGNYQATSNTETVNVTKK